MNSVCNRTTSFSLDGGLIALVMVALYCFAFFLCPIVLIFAGNRKISRLILYSAITALVGAITLFFLRSLCSFPFYDPTIEELDLKAATQDVDLFLKHSV